MEYPFDQGATQLNDEQVRALLNPARREIFERIRALRQATVEDLTAVTVRSKQSIYHHVHRLEAIGLIRKVGMRTSKTKPEAVYESAHGAVRIKREDKSPESAELMHKALGSLLRQVSRETLAASDRYYGEPGAPNPPVASRSLTRLSPEGFVELRQRISELRAWIVDHHDPGGIPVAITTVISPLTGE